MSLATARSLLFAPGHEERKLQKALAAGADVVVADLEDAVPAGEKEAARAVTRRVLDAAAPGSLVAVRPNAVGTAHWEADLAATPGSLVITPEPADLHITEPAPLVELKLDALPERAPLAPPADSSPAAAPRSRRCVEPGRGKLRRRR